MKKIHRKSLQANSNMTVTYDVKNYITEPAPMQSEVQTALKQLPNKKELGPDGIPIELWKAGGEAAIKVLTVLCQHI